MPGRAAVDSNALTLTPERQKCPKNVPKGSLAVSTT
jgi:hypothetical protein